MKKIFTVLLVALMLGGEAFAAMFSDEELLNGWAYQFSKAKAHGNSARAYSKVSDFLWSWTAPNQRPLLFRWIKARANTNEGLYELWWLGWFYYEGYGCQMNRQLGIQYIRQAAQLGVREAFQWMNSRGLR